MADSDETDELLNRGYRYALSLTLHHDDAFDLVQDSYVKLVEKKKPLVISYLITTIRNQFIDEKRRHKVRLKWEKNLSDKDTSYEPGGEVEPVLERLLSTLEPKKREILFLAIVEEYTAQEISDLMSIPRGTVLSTLSRTKKKLQVELQEKSILDL
ncbi:MAG: RNA polymerase sigma factor [Balneolaceae bacterium]